jgi:TonB family protein
MKRQLIACAIAAALVPCAAQSQTRHKPVAAVRWGDVRIAVEAASDSAVHLIAYDGVSTAVPQERVDYLGLWFDLADSAARSTPRLGPGEYVDLDEFGQGQIRVTRRVFTDSSRYLVRFFGTGTSRPLYTSATAKEFAALVRALRAADTTTRRMSGLPMTWASLEDHRGSARDAYFEFQVEKQVQTAPDSPQPRYPELLKSEKIEGEVLAQFVVDTSGRAEAATFKVLKSSHDGFTQAVRNVLPNMHFYPAEIGGRKVRQMIQQSFTFALPRE